MLWCAAVSLVAQILALVLAYLMTPGTGEITEAVVHAAVHGDTAHADHAGHEDAGSQDEHGCSGSFHACLCHHAPGFLPAPGIPALAIEVGDHSALPSPLSATPTGPPDTIFRPPIA